MSQMPEIIIRDLLATSGSVGEPLTPGSARTIELTTTALADLTRKLGGDGLLAFTAYVEVLQNQVLPDGRSVLLLNDFSARWLMETIGLGRNAAYRAQAALEDCGLFTRITSTPGQGARGKSRAALNHDLVLIRGSNDDISDLRTSRSGPSKQGRDRSAGSPLSRDAGVRDSGVSIPDSHEAGVREFGPDSHMVGVREPSVEFPEIAGVSSGVPLSGSPGSSAPTSKSEKSVDLPLLSGENSAGSLAAVLVPALRQDRGRALRLMHAELNDAQYDERLGQVASRLALSGPSSKYLSQLLELLAVVLLDPSRAPGIAKVLGLAFQPRLSVEQLAERVVVAVISGLSVRKLNSWGGWLGHCMRSDFTPLSNGSLNALSRALEAMSAPAQPRRRPVDPAAVAAGPPASAPAPEATAAAPAHVEAGVTPAGDGREPAEDEKVAPGVDEAPVTAQTGSLVSVESMSEAEVRELVELARQDPDLAALAERVGSDMTSAMARRVVRLHLLAEGTRSVG